MKISIDTYEEELALCRKHFLKKGGCCWGKCDNCGVLPLLVKLGRGELLEDSEEIEKFKNQVFK